MQKIHWEPTDNTPLIDFDFENGHLEIRGASFPEYAREFYEPILEGMREYIINPPVPHTKLVFRFTYFNTGTNSLITGVMKELESLVHSEHSVEVLWYYEPEDMDMRDLGDYFKTLTNLNMQVLEDEEVQL
jgi:SiaC family regulatory phosphoprotein